MYAAGAGVVSIESHSAVRQGIADAQQDAKTDIRRDVQVMGFRAIVD